MLLSRYNYYTYATYCSACDNLILGEIAEADLGNILSAYKLYVAEFNQLIYVRLDACQYIII